MTGYVTQTKKKSKYETMAYITVPNFLYNDDALWHKR
jgi:hypothetical protein